jgi:hypothetical protein
LYRGAVSLCAVQCSAVQCSAMQCNALGSRFLGHLTLTRHMSTEHFLNCLTDQICSFLSMLLNTNYPFQAIGHVETHTFLKKTNNLTPFAGFLPDLPTSDVSSPADPSLSGRSPNCSSLLNVLCPLPNWITQELVWGGDKITATK